MPPKRVFYLARGDLSLTAIRAATEISIRSGDDDPLVQRFTDK
jgi:hypothetical protein